MKTFAITENISDTLLERFISFSNDNWNQPWTIYINTNGGSQGISTSILFLINDHNKKYKTKIIGNRIYSGGFHIFYKTECEKFLTLDSVGMIHQGASDMRINSKSDPRYSEDIATIRNWKETKRYDYAKAILTKKEFKLYKKDHEVYLTLKRLKEIFPDATIIE